MNGRATSLLRSWTACLAICLSYAPVALAGPSEDAAREATRRATGAYNLGAYDESARYYEEAYRLVPTEASLLYNVGQAYRLAGRPEKALVAYRAFLRTSPPDAPNRAQAEQRVRELERIVADTRTSATSSPGSPSATPTATTPTQTLPPPALTPTNAAAPALVTSASPTSQQQPGAPVYTRWWFWTAIGVAATAAGVVLLLGSDQPNPDCREVSPCGTIR